MTLLLSLLLLLLLLLIDPFMLHICHVRSNSAVTRISKQKGTQLVTSALFETMRKIHKTLMQVTVM
jgi:hypothetical protein